MRGSVLVGPQRAPHTKCPTSLGLHQESCIPACLTLTGWWGVCTTIIYLSNLVHKLLLLLLYCVSKNLFKNITCLFIVLNLFTLTVLVLISIIIILMSFISCVWINNLILLLAFYVYLKKNVCF